MTSKKLRLIQAVARIDPRVQPSRRTKQAQRRQVSVWSKAAGRRDRR